MKLLHISVALFLYAVAVNPAGASVAFTLNPAAAGMNGAAFTADNANLSEFAAVNISGNAFTETGFLPITNFLLGGNIFTPTGLNAAGGYSLFITFTDTGHLNGN